MCQYIYLSCSYLDSQISETENSLAISHDNGAHVGFRPVLQNVIDVTFVVDGNEKSLK
jgi:hypothetical protein